MSNGSDCRFQAQIVCYEIPGLRLFGVGVRVAGMRSNNANGKRAIAGSPYECYCVSMVASMGDPTFYPLDTRFVASPKLDGAGYRFYWFQNAREGHESCLFDQLEWPFVWCWE